MNKDHKWQKYKWKGISNEWVLLDFTLSGDWKLSKEAITPVIFSTQSIWSDAFSACIGKEFPSLLTSCWRRLDKYHKLLLDKYSYDKNNITPSKFTRKNVLASISSSWSTNILPVKCNFLLGKLSWSRISDLTALRQLLL